MKTKYYKYLVVLFLTVSQNIKCQVLNLPLLPEIQCNTWCWAISCRHIIYYYGNDNITLCEIAEYARTRNPNRFGQTNCCQSIDNGCCNGNFLSGAGGMTEIFSHWGLSPNYTFSPLTKNEITIEISNNRPFVIRYPGHVDICYGIVANDIYIRDPGWGFDIRDYNTLISGTNNNNKWTETIRINESPVVCDFEKSLTGTISYSNIYKASGIYDVSCIINNNSIITIKAPDSITLSPGFSIELGSSLELQTGSNLNINCP